MKISSNFHNRKMGITKTPPKIKFFRQLIKYNEKIMR